MLCNVIYQHLRAPLRHDGECGPKCSKTCDVAALDASLDLPVTRAEAEKEERLQQALTNLNKRPILA